MTRDNRPACAVCKHQRKKCGPECILAVYFPAPDRTRDFDSVHKVFGVSNTLKLLREAEHAGQGEDVVKSLVWEATMWQQDPVHGPLGAYRRLEEEVKLLKEHNLALINQQATLAAASAVANPKPQQEIEVRNSNLGWGSTNYDYYQFSANLNSPIHSFTRLLNESTVHVPQPVIASTATFAPETRMSTGNTSHRYAINVGGRFDHRGNIGGIPMQSSIPVNRGIVSHLESTRVHWRRGSDRMIMNEMQRNEECWRGQVQEWVLNPDTAAVSQHHPSRSISTNDGE